MTAAPKDAPTDIHYSERHTGSPGMTLPEGTCPRRASLARCFPFDMAEKVKHRRPEVRFSRETVSAARVTSSHCSTLWVREQNLGECKRIPHARNSRGITQDSKRRGQRGSTGPPHWLVSGANVAGIVTGFLQANSSSVLGLVSLSFTPFLGWFAASLCTLNPVSWTSPQCTRSGKCESQSFGFTFSNSLFRHMHPCRCIFQPSKSFTVVTKSKQSPETSISSQIEAPSSQVARDTFFHHLGSSPLLSTCRHVEVSAVDVHVVLIGFFFLSQPSSSHAKPLLLVVVLLQCAEIAAYVLFPYLGCLRNISLAIGDFKANESLVNVLRSSRPIITVGCWTLDVRRWTSKV